MKRVLIVGCPGAGKSTAARQLAEITGLPLVLPHSFSVYNDHIIQ